MTKANRYTWKANIKKAHIRSKLLNRCKNVRTSTKLDLDILHLPTTSSCRCIVHISKVSSIILPNILQFDPKKFRNMHMNHWMQNAYMSCPSKVYITCMSPLKWNMLSIFFFFFGHFQLSLNSVPSRRSVVAILHVIVGLCQPNEWQSVHSEAAWSNDK